LGVTFDDRLSFSPHVQKVVQKSKCHNSAMKLVRQKLIFDQFLKVLTCQFCSKVYYLYFISSLHQKLQYIMHIIDFLRAHITSMYHDIK